MIFYRTSANPFELADGSVIAAQDSKIYASNFSHSNRGPVLGSSLISKIGTGTSNPRAFSGSIKTYPPIGIGGLLDPSLATSPLEHEPITLYASNPAYKCYPVLTDQYLQVIYKEMKHNGTQWGDDNKFNIVDKQSTVTDLNGETVIVGQKRVELPYHFDGVQY